MTLYKSRGRVESARCPNWDYASNGWYFVTICTRDRHCFLGQVAAKQVQLPAAGEITERIWRKIPEHFPNARLNAFVIMPNHRHGIVGIDRENSDCFR